MKVLRLGEILVNNKTITNEQLDKALTLQRSTPGKKIGDIIIENGWASEREIVEALAIKLNIKTVTLYNIQVENKYITKIPKALAEKQLVLPIGEEADKLIIATNDPLNFYTFEEIRQITGQETSLRLSTTKDLRDAIAKYYSEAGAQHAAHEANKSTSGIQTPTDTKIEVLSTNSTEDGPVINLLNSLISRALATGASDIHIEPFESELNIRMRIDGALVQYISVVKALQGPLIARIKIMAELDIAEKRIPQDGHFRVTIDNQNLNMRVSILPTEFGEKAVLRLLVSGGNVGNVKSFGMTDINFKRFLPLLDYPNGIIYITGPTGSGKTTTLYLALEYLSSRTINISSIEDPVEKHLDHINQTQTNEAAGMTFAVGLRALLRQDPDVIMIGETRDNETAEISVRAAITGHIVLSTLHTNSAASSITRLEDMGVAPYMVSNSVIGIMAQRLMRRNCPHCSEWRAPTEREKALIGLDIPQVKSGKGCSRCNNTGFHGRVAIHELLVIDKEIRKLISNSASIDDIEAYAKTKQGMKFLEEQGLDLVREGITAPYEMTRIISSF